MSKLRWMPCYKFTIDRGAPKDIAEAIEDAVKNGKDFINPKLLANYPQTINQNDPSLCYGCPYEMEHRLFGKNSS